MRYSVIDISSSGVSYIVADTADDGSPSAEIILKDRMYLGLSFFMDGNILTDEGIDKLCDCLKTVRDTCARIGVRRCVVVSTASLRNMTNSEEVESEILRRLGLYVNYIDGETEAYCDYAANVFYAGMDSPVVIDIGGKSIEICDLGKTGKDEMICLEFGLLDLRGRFVSRDNPTPDEAEEIKKFARYRFDDAGLPGEGAYRTAVLAGATCGAVYDVYQAFSKNQPKNGPKVMDRKTFKKMVRYLISDSGRSRLMLSVAPERLALIIPACIVLRNLFKRFDVETIIVSDRGVKEGYLSMLLGGAGDILVNELGEDTATATEDARTENPAFQAASGTEAASGTDGAEGSAPGTPEPEETAEEETAEVFPREADAEETSWAEEVPEAPQDEAPWSAEPAGRDTAEAFPQETDAEETAWSEEVPDVPMQETSCETYAADTEEPAVKRGRGRPRKYPVAAEEGQDGVAAVKRGRGRPRKNPDEVPVKVGTGKRGRPRKYPVADDAAAEAAGVRPGSFEAEDAAGESEEWYADENAENRASAGYGTRDAENGEFPVPAGDPGAFGAAAGYDDAESVDDGYGDIGSEEVEYGDTGSEEVEYGDTGSEEVEYGDAGPEEVEYGDAESVDDGYGDAESVDDGYGDAGYEGIGYDDTGYGSDDISRMSAGEDAADMSAEEAWDVAAESSDGAIEPTEDTAGPETRGNGSVQVTMDDFASDDEYDPEDDFENELDEPVVETDALKETADASAEDAVTGTAGEAAADPVAEAGANPGPGRPAGTGKPRGRGAGKAASARKSASKGKAAAKKKPSGTSGRTAGGDVEDGSVGRRASETGTASAQAPAEVPADTSADVPVEPVYAPGPGEEVLSDRTPERRVAPYVDAYEDSTDESGSFSDFAPIDVSEAADEDAAAPDVPEEEDAVHGLSGMADIDEDFSPFSGDDADFVGKADDDE